MERNILKNKLDICKDLYIKIKKTIFSNGKENIQLKQSNNANQGINLISKTAF